MGELEKGEGRRLLPGGRLGLAGPNLVGWAQRVYTRGAKVLDLD